MKDGPAFQLYAADFYMDTVGWSVAQVGIYFRLLMYEWVNESLPNDIKRLARIAGIDVGNFKKCYLQDISNKFTANGGGELVNLRLEETRGKQRKYRESQADKSKLAVAARQKKATRGSTNGFTPSTTPSQPLHLQSSSSNKDIKDMRIFVILKDNTNYEIGAEKIEQYKQTYQKVDVVQELQNCVQWNIDNPGKRKTKTGILKHINTWLSKANKDKGYIAQAQEPDLTAQREREEYLASFTPDQLKKNEEKIYAITQGFLNKKTTSGKKEYTKAEIEAFIKENWPSKKGLVTKEQAREIDKFIRSVKIKEDN